jgi:hypothetical protein
MLCIFADVSVPYDFLESEKVIKGAIEEFDEKRVLLGRAPIATDVKKAEDAGNKALVKKLEEQSWLFAAAHHSVESLSRQAEAIVSAQWAMVHEQGLHFWQGRHRWFRYAGDGRQTSFDCRAI